MSRLDGSAGTVTLSRSLPLTWTGISRVASAMAATSTSGQASRMDRRPGARPSASRRLHSSSVMCGAAGASISSSSRIASSHSAAAGDRRAAVAEQGVRQLHQLGDHRVEAERLVVGGDVAQRLVAARAERRPASASVSPAGSEPESGSPASRPLRVQRRASRPGSGSDGRRRSRWGSTDRPGPTDP